MRTISGGVWKHGELVNEVARRVGRSGPAPAKA
jgi:hypothetical protein